MARCCAAPPPQAAASRRATVRAATGTPRDLVTGLSSWRREGVSPGWAHNASRGLLTATYGRGTAASSVGPTDSATYTDSGHPVGGIGRPIGSAYGRRPVGVAVRWRRPDRSKGSAVEKLLQTLI